MENLFLLFYFSSYHVQLSTDECKAQKKVACILVTYIHYAIVNSNKNLYPAKKWFKVTK